MPTTTSSSQSGNYGLVTSTSTHVISSAMSDKSSVSDVDSNDSSASEPDAISTAGTRRPQDGCTDTKRVQVYLQGIGSFVQKLRDDIGSILKQKTVYDRVFVLVVYWRKSDVKHIRIRAKELKKCFEEDFSFEAEAYPLTSGNKDLDFNDKLSEIIRKLKPDDQSNLFILYYGGHGYCDDQGGRCLWKPQKDSAERDSLVWSDFERLLRYAECDVLYLFDCCFGLAMIDGPEQGGSGGWRRRCEIFSSAGLVEQAGGDEENSFTKALIKELKLRKDAAGFSIEALATLFTTKKMRDKHKLVATPAWHMWSGKQWKSSIVLAKKGDASTSNQQSDSRSPALQLQDIEELKAMTDTVILIAISFENPMRLPVAEEWSRWFQNRPPNIGNIELAVLTEILADVKLTSIHESNSELALVTIPTWLWNWLTPHPAIRKIGIVRTPNLLPPEFSQGLPLYRSNIEPAIHPLPTVYKGKNAADAKEPPQPPKIPTSSLRPQSSITSPNNAASQAQASSSRQNTGPPQYKSPSSLPIYESPRGKKKDDARTGPHTLLGDPQLTQSPALSFATDTDVPVEEISRPSETQRPPERRSMIDQLLSRNKKKQPPALPPRSDQTTPTPAPETTSTGKKSKQPPALPPRSTKGTSSPAVPESMFTGGLPDDLTFLSARENKLVQGYAFDAMLQHRTRGVPQFV